MSDEPKSAFRGELDELGRKIDRMRIRWAIGLLLGYFMALWLLLIVLERQLGAQLNQVISHLPK